MSQTSLLVETEVLVSHGEAMVDVLATSMHHLMIHTKDTLPECSANIRASCTCPDAVSCPLDRQLVVAQCHSHPTLKLWK